jgi:(S)-2-hydroxyglutarate dehydrogenase
VARSLEAELRSRGAEFKLGCRVSALRRRDGTTVLTHDDGQTGARWAIACAGLWSDRLAEDAGAPADPRIIPFRGAYLRLQRDQPPVVRGLVYPVPDPALPFLGVHITKQINGDVLLGPTAMVVGAKDAYKIRTMRLRDLASTFLWPGTWRVGGRFWKTALNEIHMAVSRKDFVRACSVYLPALRRMKLEPVGQAGVRAQAVARDGTLVDDFVISETPGATHLRNAPSPAATSSLALAREVVDRLEKNLS